MGVSLAFYIITVGFSPNRLVPDAAQNFRSNSLHSRTFLLHVVPLICAFFFFSGGNLWFTDLLVSVPFQLLISKKVIQTDKQLLPYSFSSFKIF